MWLPPHTVKTRRQPSRDVLFLVPTGEKDEMPCCACLSERVCVYVRVCEQVVQSWCWHVKFPVARSSQPSGRVALYILYLRAKRVVICETSPLQIVSSRANKATFFHTRVVRALILYLRCLCMARSKIEKDTNSGTSKHYNCCRHEGFTGGLSKSTCLHRLYSMGLSQK